MTIEEAIRHCREQAGKIRVRAVECANAYDREGAESCHECAAEHEQLAEWLEELQEKRSKVGGLIERIRELESDVAELQDSRQEAREAAFAAYARIDELVRKAEGAKE